MLFIYKQIPNKVLRTTLKPFSRIIPSKYHFPVNGSYIICLEEGKKINFLCNPTSYLGRVLFWRGFKGFEYNLTRIFIQLVKTSGVFFDIGANIGYYSLLAKAYNKNIQVSGFEPMPASYKYFQKNTELNNFHDIRIEQLALSSQKGEAVFYAVYNPKFKEIEDHLAGDGSINPNVGKRSNQREIKVNTDTLDNYVKDNQINKIDLIKLDTEASEHLVLSGAQHILEHHKPLIMCEVLPDQIEDKLDAIFKKYNYLYFKAYPEGLKQIDSLHHSDEINDYLMVPENKTATISRFILEH